MPVAPHRPLLTVDEFIASADEREGKWELREGVAVCMAPEQLGHVLTKHAAVNALTDAIRRAGSPCIAIPDGIGVRTSTRSLRQPDALVYCGPPLSWETREVPDPVIVVEVLSPSTAAYDMSEKLEGYFSLPGVMHYLLLSPGSRMCIHHKRGQGDLIETRILREGPLRLDPPGLELQAQDMFAAA